MPRGKRNWKKRPSKRMYRKKYKVSVGKLMDRKVNTLLEKRMVETAKKEIAKSIVYFKPQSTIKSVNFDWLQHGFVERVPTSSFLTVASSTLQHTRLTDFGDWIENNVATNDGTALRSNYIRCKSMKNWLRFRHSGIAPIKIYVWIISVPGSQPLSQQVTIPDVDTLPSSFGNGLNKHLPKIRRENLDYKYQVHAKRMVVIGPGKPYLSPMVASNVGSNQGYTFTNTAQAWSEREKTINIDVYFKGRGKKFQVQDGNTRTVKQEYFLCMIADSQFQVLGDLQQTIYLDKLTDQAQLASPPE